MPAMKEKKFIVTIEMEIEVSAKNLEFAKKLVKEESHIPSINVFGCSTDDGSYSVKSKRNIKILSIYSK